MSSKRLPFLLLVLMFTLVLAACQGQQSIEEPALTEAAIAPTAVPPTEAAVEVAEANPLAGEEAWIAYQTCRRDCRNGQIHLMRPDGTEDHQVAGDIAAPTTKLPDWSPDGTRLVVATQDGETEELYEYDLATDSSRPLFECVDFGPGCFTDEPDYSPDGTKVAFLNYGGGLAYSEKTASEVPIECDLYIGDLASGELTRITSNLDDCNREYLPRWSPDGTRFVYTSDPYEAGRPTGTSVWVMNIDGTGKRQLTDPDMISGEADWTADGQWIVFATYPLFEYGETPEPSNLYRIHPDGSGLEQLTFFESADLRATQPRPTPDGKWILFTADRADGSRSLWAIPNEGGEPFEILAGGIYTHAVWQPQAAASAGEARLTQRLAIPETTQMAAYPYIREFQDQVEALSGGEMAIELVWDAGADTPEGVEHGVLAAVLAGDYELGLAATRVFEHEGITTFQPLQTPFLIDNDALSIAVAESDVSAGMLEALSSAGLVGLALWPEDLRHPFSVIPGQPVLSPDDLARKTVRTTSEGVTKALIEALGGVPVLFADPPYQRAESGLLQGYSLEGNPIATANLVYFPKFQVFFGNAEAFAGLNPEQQVVLRDAAAAVQVKALAEHPGDVAAGEAWCADGGTVVLAGEEQIAAFKEAAQPVIDMIVADPANAEAVAALTALKESTEPSAGAKACAPAAQPEADPSTYANGVLNGTWGYVASEDEAGLFLDGYRVTADEVRLQLGFDNEEWWETPAFDGESFLENGEPAGDGGTFQIEGDRLITIGANGRAQITFEWSLDGDQLTLVAVEECDITSNGLNCHDSRSQMDRIMLKVMEHTYTKISDSPRPW